MGSHGQGHGCPWLPMRVFPWAQYRAPMGSHGQDPMGFHGSPWEPDSVADTRGGSSETAHKRPRPQRQNGQPSRTFLTFEKDFLTNVHACVSDGHSHRQLCSQTNSPIYLTNGLDLLRIKFAKAFLGFSLLSPSHAAGSQAFVVKGVFGAHRESWAR